VRAAHPHVVCLNDDFPTDDESAFQAQWGVLKDYLREVVGDEPAAAFEDEAGCLAPEAAARHQARVYSDKHS
jgi:hypothetical protein